MKVHTQPVIASVSSTVRRPTRTPRAATINESLPPPLFSEVGHSVRELLDVELEVVTVMMPWHSKFSRINLDGLDISLTVHVHILS